MDTLQPSRSLGRKERAIPLGVLYRIKINPNDTIACFGCDGIDDNGATNENNFGQFVVNPKKMNILRFHFKQESNISYNFHRK